VYRQVCGLSGQADDQGGRPAEELDRDFEKPPRLVIIPGEGGLHWKRVSESNAEPDLENAIMAFSS
jgi:hypothetical protein